jgi:hypothetical protein
VGSPDPLPAGRYDVFISYVRADLDLVRPFVELLKRDGFRVWFDLDEMPGGTPVIARIADMIYASACMIACFSDDYMGRTWPEYELIVSQNRDPAGLSALTIPVQFRRLTKQVPIFVRHLTMMDFSDPQLHGEHYRRICEEIRRRVAAHVQPPDDEAVRKACEAALGSTGDEMAKLAQVRGAITQLVHLVHRRVCGADPRDASLDQVLVTLASAALPAEVIAQLPYLRAQGNEAMLEPAHESDPMPTLAPAIAALRTLTTWAFPSGTVRPAQVPDVPVARRGAGDPIHAARRGGGLRLRSVSPVEARDAWPAPDRDVVVWERRTGTLAVVSGDDIRWRDGRSMQVRTTATGSGHRLAVGGWDGAVRIFTGGPPRDADVDGTVGALAFTSSGLVVGSWKHDLQFVSDDGVTHALVSVERGVHRVAVADDAERFAVLDLAGGVAIYSGLRRTQTLPPSEPLADIAYAGARLVMVSEEAVTGLRVDGRLDQLIDKPGARELLVGGSGRCLLVVLVPDATDAGQPRMSIVAIDEADSHVPVVAFEPGDCLLSAGLLGDRFTVANAGGGCAYWREGSEVARWPETLSARLSRDGDLIVLTYLDRVEVFEDTE